MVGAGLELGRVGLPDVGLQAGSAHVGGDNGLDLAFGAGDARDADELSDEADERGLLRLAPP